MSELYEILGITAGNGTLSRLKVEGGWLYIVENSLQKTAVMTFVPEKSQNGNEPRLQTSSERSHQE